MTSAGAPDRSGPLPPSRTVVSAGTGTGPLLRALVGGRGRPVEVAGERLAPAELLSAAWAVADRVGGAGVVAVEASPCPGTVVAVVGCLLAGVVVVPVPPDAGPLDRGHLFRDSGATLLLVPEGGPPPPVRAEPVPGQPAVVPVDLSARSAGRGPEPPAEQPALLLYTSGTTGAPKGVLLSRAAIATDLDLIADAWAWTPADTLVHGLPLFHVHGLVLGVLGALRVGSALVHTGRPTPAGYAAVDDGTLFFGVPTVWGRVGRDPGAAAALRRARLLVSGSAPLPRDVHDRVRALTGHRLLERYGMTETLITVSGRVAGERRPGWVGTALPGIDLRLDEVTDGVGELLVRTPTRFEGYLGRPEATAAALDAEGWFRTGDLASVDADGWVRILGRCSEDLIKSGGYRIGAGEVEDALRAHPGVREAAVVGEPDPDLGQRLVGYVVADGVSGPQLVDFVAGTLSVHKRPREVHVLDDLPRTALGKVRKSLLGGGHGGLPRIHPDGGSVAGPAPAE